MASPLLVSENVSPPMTPNPPAECLLFAADFSGAVSRSFVETLIGCLIEAT
jgi:hypothetical protein